MKTRLNTIKKREDFYSLIYQALNVVVKGKESELLLFNIWGPHGSGKTYALNEIRNGIAEQDKVKVFGPIDVSEHNYKLLDEILLEVTRTEKQYKKLILLDNLKSTINDGQDDTFIYEAEERLIGPVISNGDVVVVISSLHEIKQWRSMEVRIRHKTLLMAPLSTKVFKTLIKAAELNYITTHKKTIGHPKLLDWLIENPNLNEEELNKKAVDYFLNGLGLETRKIAQVISLSFSFNIPEYQRAVSLIGLRKEDSYFSDLKRIKEMGSIGLVVYESNTGMYRFSDPILRKVLARSFRQEFPDLAAKVYRELAELSTFESQFANSLPSHLLNAIYYQLWNCNFSKFSFSQWINEWFGGMNDAWSDVDWDDVGYEIHQNPMSKYILDEIKELAGLKIYKTIILKIHLNRRIKK